MRAWRGLELSRISSINPGTPAPVMARMPRSDSISGIKAIAGLAFESPELGSIVCQLLRYVRPGRTNHLSDRIIQRHNPVLQCRALLELPRGLRPRRLPFVVSSLREKRGPKLCKIKMNKMEFEKGSGTKRGAALSYTSQAE